MTGAQQSFPVGAWRRYVRGWVAIACLCGIAPGQVGSVDAWKAAVAARGIFEQEPVGQHTPSEYAAVMDRFRAIYHGNPADLYAPRAVDAVAELLAEEGRELKDRKCLRDAEGQYAFLAKAYPASSLAAPGLRKALALLGPGAADDAGEAMRRRALLEGQYPRSAAAKATADAGKVRAAQKRLDPAEEHRVPSGRTTKEKDTQLGSADNQRRMPGAAPAMVTGIRHWSTATYTRVAVDLGGEVEFQAARVEHPDRIFFDLHGAKLAPGLLGKSFAITDDGFLKTIRAGQSDADVTRIVLDVQPVAEYSAFLLPNPTRLIIDIHGRAVSQEVSQAATQPVSEPATQTTTQEGRRLANPAAAHGGEGAPAPVVRFDPRGQKSTGNQVSSLPPMPVTDGSAEFGLPPKRTQAAPPQQHEVARPRVVLSAQPTMARPVPNSTSSATPATSREIAAVSEGPGVIAATPEPTSRPVVDRARDRAQESGSRAQKTRPEPSFRPRRANRHPLQQAVKARLCVLSA